MTKRSFIDQIAYELDEKEVVVLAERLGMTETQLRNAEARENWTPAQVGKLAVKLISKRPEPFVRPIVEYFPLYNESSLHGAAQEIFTTKNGDGTEHSWFRGLKDELMAANGVYVFYDSRGHALYVGKAAKQKLWKEIRNAYNRPRDVQKISLVDHPLSRQYEYRSSNEKTRKIVKRSVPLYKLAYYLSVYEVSDSAIEDVEALLIRGFANDLMNVRMETFSHSKGSSKDDA